MEVYKSVIEGPNGEFIFNIIEDIEDIAKLNNEIKTEVDGWSNDRSRRMNVSVPPRLYYYWANKLGEQCWLDTSFLKSFMKEHPEYATCDHRRI